MKKWPVIRHVRFTYHTWKLFYTFDPDKMIDPMQLEYLAGIKEGAW